MRFVLLVTAYFMASMANQAFAIQENTLDICESMFSSNSLKCAERFEFSFHDPKALEVCSYKGPDRNVMACLEATENKEYTAREIQFCEGQWSSKAISCLNQRGTAVLGAIIGEAIGGILGSFFNGGSSDSTEPSSTPSPSCKIEKREKIIELGFNLATGTSTCVLVNISGDPNSNGLLTKEGKKLGENMSASDAELLMLFNSMTDCKKLTCQVSGR